MTRYAKALTPAEIAAVKDADIDFSDIAEFDESFWRDAERVEPDRTERITLMSEPSTTSHGATAAPTAPATYQDILDAPEHLVAELIGGMLHTHPRPAPRHASAGAGLMRKLGPAFHDGSGGPGGWRIFYEPELHLDEEVLVPDLAGWRRERMTALPETAYFALAPDWICEILSPSTRSVDLVHKRPIYAATRIRYLWLVDPVEQILEAFALDDGQWRLIAAVEHDDAVQIPPFDAITFRLGDLWN